jgi:hypothetical protein
MLIVILGACSPDRFTLDKISGQNRIDGFEMRTIHDAEVKYDNAFILNEQGCVSLRAVNWTDGTWDFGLNFLFGGDINIVFRDVPFEYKSPRGIAVNISKGVLKITDAGKEVHLQKLQNDLSSTARFKFSNDGFNYSLIIDCDTIYKGKSTIPSTEYVIFESLNSTKAFISGIDFKKK